MLRFSRNRKTIAIFAGTAAAVIGYVVFVIIGQQQHKGGERAAFPPARSTVVYAAKGEITPGFPKELILDERASLAQSYAIAYDQNLNQYTVAFDSDQSMSALYDAYLSYFKENGWTMVNAIAKYPASRGLYAKKGTADASVAILEKDSSAQVIVSYVVK